MNETFLPTGDIAEMVDERAEDQRAAGIMFREPGVYFGLPEAEYFADSSLGSSDMKRIAYSPADYWFESRMNPAREPDAQTPSQFFGTAAHKIILEGRDAFEAIYAPVDYPGNIKAGKDERAAIEARGMLPIKRADFNRLQMAAAMIRGNAPLAQSFIGGVPEVSVFWEKDGIPKRARIDYLKLRASVDLKSIRNSRQIEFHEACRRAIAEYRYDTQAAHYREGREALRTLVKQGRVFGDHDAEWLRKVADVEEFASVIIFYQAEGAPLSWGTTISPGNGLLDLACATLSKAEHNYREFKERFGLMTPWVVEMPLEEIDVNDLPAWSFRA